MPLQDNQCKNAVTPSKGVTKLFDGGGLFLQIDSKGGKYWRFQFYRPEDKKKDILALGVYPEVTLKLARLKRDKAKLLLAEGINPKKQHDQNDTQMIQSNTFQIIATQWFDNRKGDTERWTPKYAARTWRCIELYLLPFFGSMSINAIKPLNVLTVIKHIEADGKQETSRRVLSIARQIFAYSVKMGLSEFNPASDLASELKTYTQKHYPYFTDENKLRELLQTIDTYQGSPAVTTLLRLSPYVFQRPSEVRTMRWCELDLEKGLWTKEAGDMKNRFNHVIPLCRQVIALLHSIQSYSGHVEYVFWNYTTHKPITEAASRKTLERLGYKGLFTPHGWRHTASTLLHEQGFDTLWIEAQLSHKDRNQIRGTYNHAQYLEQRRQMMQTWADYLDKLKQ